MLAVFRSGGKLNFSQIHRSMKRDHDYWRDFTGGKSKCCVSRVQLRRILKDTDIQGLKAVAETTFNANETIDPQALQWFSIDGKELRGSIDKSSGDKRGESVVLVTAQEDKTSKVVGYYSGTKDSERGIVDEYFETQSGLSGTAYTMDALHNNSGLLEGIHGKRGVYLSQIKGNQKILREDLRDMERRSECLDYKKTVEKGHGRIETRIYRTYPVETGCLERRWSNTGMSCFIRVDRTRKVVKTGKTSSETSYYVSNINTGLIDQYNLPNAVRGHWSVEANNNMRDTNFGEDGLRSLVSGIQQSVSCILTAVMNILIQRNAGENMNEMREEIVADINSIHQYFNR
ncbi:hypothetical protein FUAX_54980 (plasmid) [Fulvitalea axinellae]|uniref:Transposase n=1 Tax=Fulvitalea axinellae TaxID=1182444 RepID=A0AAU9CVI0_9BACT|nr:hypothetical protein FUAX_00550 [Fulvitalea axinellae]BDD07898.1 hypothetical protein FUAX_03300 [Fulvitalea axinellae]BDD08066.1 hypothetical protein FUAX_04980 [Fulvitalea axinellae]BDD08076.1 hypothetical protein FUAX_05080 [Fulvitalea axinellae]BDD09351.1 hypothetical protein FUAX_17830 [Fulvitalea axinellae]